MKINEDILTDEGKVICDLTNIFTNKNIEINRLNNIIDELEKYLKEMSDRSWDDNGAYDDVLNKLNELGSKNE